MKKRYYNMSMIYLILSYVFGLMIVKKMCLSNLKLLFNFLNVWLDINNVEGKIYLTVV